MSNGTAVIVIPARYASTRLPGKPLLPLLGKPLIQWVWERTLSCRRASRVLIATDDTRICETVRRFGAECVMTRADHPSGTDRIAEAIEAVAADVVVNVQGDEPLIEPALIDRSISVLADEEGWDMATACAPLTSAADLRNPAVVKVVRSADGRALYFSREPIPHIRGAATDDEILAADLHRRHIGLYAYRREFLKRFVAAPPSALEQAEKLEQLRALELGGRIKVLDTHHAGLGVDTPEDVPRAEQALRALAGH